MKFNLKSTQPYILSIIILFIVSCIFFYPNLLGEKLPAGDSISSYEKTYHIKEFKKETGRLSKWNSAQFSGGPFGILNLGKDYNLIGKISDMLINTEAKVFFMYFLLVLSAFVSLSLLKVDWKLALFLSIAYSLSYTFFTLIEAGHNKKVATLIFIPLVISGFLNINKENYFKGGLALLLGTSLSIHYGHIQMVYYLILAMIPLALCLVVFDLRQKKDIVTISKTLGFAVLVALVAAGTNYSQLYNSNEFSKSTMRGGGILPKEEKKEVKKEGLDWDYAMQWSYNTNDLLNILVPRIQGGGSQEIVDKTNPIAILMLQNGGKVENGKVAIPGYWGQMIFTSGGSYIGAGIFALFIVSLFFLEKKYIVAFLSSILIIFLLALGNYAEWFNHFLFNNLPLFNKFRAPSSALSILPAFLLVGTGIGTQYFFNELNLTDKANLKKLFIGIGISLSVMLLIWLKSLGFDYLSANDLNYPNNIQSILVEGRAELLKSDLTKSFFIVVVIATILFLYFKNIVKSKNVVYSIIAIIVIVDLYTVSSRVLTVDDFTSKKKYETQFLPRPVDNQISQMEPKGRGFYRVFDMSVNTFNSAKPALFHNQIGGYDPTKLQRYQDLIDRHIYKNNMEVLNMLNTKYFITKEGQVSVNNQANGNAWFVQNLETVQTDLEEINKLGEIKTKTTAVIKEDELNKNTSIQVKAGNAQGDIQLIKYTPDQLTYNSKSNEEQFAVFSEIWYDKQGGWKAYIDGVETSLYRVNYTLRGLQIPAGEHEIVMEFFPVAKGRFISLIFSIIGLLFVLFIVLNTLGIFNKPAVNNE